MHRAHDFHLLVVAAIAACFGCSGACAGQDLPPKATWSAEPPAFPTVAEAFSVLSKLDTPYLSRDKTQVSFSIHDARWRGMWAFSGGDVTTHPTRYWRYMIVPGDDWNIKVSWGCDESKSACEQFRREIGGQLPPTPPLPPPPSFGESGSVNRGQPLEPRDPSKPSSDLAVKLVRAPLIPREFSCAVVHTTTYVIVLVSKDGKPKDVTIDTSSGDPSLDRAALDAAKRFAFNPEIFNGHPVESRGSIPFVFDSGPGSGPDCVPVRTVTLLADSQSVQASNRMSVASFAAGSAVPVRIEHGLPVGTNLLVRWINDSEASAVTGERQVSSDGSGLANTSYLPEGGWKNGRYHVEVRVGSVLVGWIRFVVRQPPSNR